ncbi:MAG: PPC domain-containing protein [Verrucomicrobiota bacterium]
MSLQPKNRSVRSVRSVRSSEFRLKCLIPLAISFLLAAPAFSQQQSPVIGYAFPAGGRQGTQFEVAVGGANLTGTTAAVLSGTGVSAEIVKTFKPLNGGREREIRDLLQAEREKLKKEKPPARFPKDDDLLTQIAGRVGISADEVAAYREGIMQKRDPKHQLNPQLVERVTLRMKVTPDAPPGKREVRLLTPNGLSNPMVFLVGVLPEVMEVDPNDKPADVAASPVKIPAVINGRILPGDVDCFSFDARAGMKLTVAVAARELIPYLADAVPGWFQANISLLDSKQHEIGFSDDFCYRPDPLLCVSIPTDGRYTLRIRDSICRGREDFIYRISVGELPCLTEQFPAGGQIHTKVDVRVAGWNLPERTLTVDAGDTPGLRNIGLQAPAIGFVRFEAGSFPEFVATVSDAKPGVPWELSFPCVANALISKPGEHDVFAVRLQAGAEVVAEIRARRLGSPLDSMLRVTDADGKLIVSNDDYDDPTAGLETHHADSRVAFTAPKEGIYQFHVSDTQSKGSRAHAYRLTIAPPQPGFDLRIVPSGINGRAGAMVPITAHVMRHDGFTGAIDLSLKDAPPGFGLAGAKIPAGTDSVRLSVKMPNEAGAAPVPLAIEGRARIGNEDVVRMAVPADDRMQAFFFRHLVPADVLLAWVMAKPQGAKRPPEALAGIEKFRAACAVGVAIPTGGTATLRLPGLGALSNNKPLIFALNAPPPGITLETKPNGNTMDFIFKADAAKTKSGPLGNLIVNVFTEVQPPQVEGKPAKPKRSIQVATLPPIPCTVADKSK